jgi:antitoxin HicB
MREAGLGREALAARLGTDEAAVRRLLDLDRKTPIAQIDHALAALGKRLVVAVEDAA